MNVLFTDTGWNQYTEWQGQDKKTVKRIYEMSDNQIIVKFCKGHYED